MKQEFIDRVMKERVVATKKNIYAAFNGRFWKCPIEQAMTRPVKEWDMIPGLQYEQTRPNMA